LIDQRLLKALSHPTRQLILDLLVEGPSSPVRMMRRMDGISLNLVSHHIKVLKELGCIELVETQKKRGATEHIYRVTRRHMFKAEEWEALAPQDRPPITANVLRLISEDTGRAFAEGKMDERSNNHLSRSPLDLDEEGWSEVVEILARALDEIQDANARSAERSQESGETLSSSRVMIMQFPIGRYGAGDDKSDGA
jgi:DNA-binding transcriptional ArsR family regulator